MRLHKFVVFYVVKLSITHTAHPHSFRIKIINLLHNEITFNKVFFLFVLLEISFVCQSRKAGEENLFFLEKEGEEWRSAVSSSNCVTKFFFPRLPVRLWSKPGNVPKHRGSVPESHRQKVRSVRVHQEKRASSHTCSVFFFFFARRNSPARTQFFFRFMLMPLRVYTRA